MAAILWGQTTDRGFFGTHGTALVTSITFAATAAGWLGWAAAGPGDPGMLATGLVYWTGLCGSLLLFLHPTPALCWCAIWACVDAGAYRPLRIGLPLAVACCGILLAGYLMHRGNLLATFTAITFVAYVVGRNRRSHSRAVTLAERGRIASELHDILGHSLTALSLHVEAAAAALQTAGDSGRALAHLATAARLSRTGQEETAAAVRTLRDGAVGVHALANHLIGGCGLPAELTVRGRPRPLPATTGMAVYRLLQEAPTNVGKHAPGAHATVTLSYQPDALIVTVDNAAVPDAGPVGTAGPASGGQGAGGQGAGDRGVGGQGVIGQGLGGHGLGAMRERITEVGGTLVAGATADRWRVRARVPA